MPSWTQETNVLLCLDAFLTRCILFHEQQTENSEVNMDLVTRFGRIGRNLEKQSLKGVEASQGHRHHNDADTQNNWTFCTKGAVLPMVPSPL